MPASPMTIDFTKAPDLVQHSSGNPQDEDRPNRPLDSRGRLLEPKNIRARARRRMKRNEVMTQQELDYLYMKPVEEWDLAELAQGRPKNSHGHFKGPKPKFVTAIVHEEAMAKYTAAVKTSMRATTVDALGLLNQLIGSEEVDEKGKPLVPASVKLDAAKFLIEHVIGKPTQRIESDVSVKLQGILGQVMVNPADLAQSQQNYNLGHLPGFTMELAEKRDDDDDFDPTEGQYDS